MVPCGNWSTWGIDPKLAEWIQQIPGPTSGLSVHKSTVLGTDTEEKIPRKTLKLTGLWHLNLPPVEVLLSKTELLEKDLRKSLRVNRGTTVSSEITSFTVFSVCVFSDERTTGLSGVFSVYSAIY